MPRRTKVNSLKYICIDNICMNMKSFWYEKYWKDIYSSPVRIISEVSKFEYLPGYLLNKITEKLMNNTVVEECLTSSLITSTLVRFTLPIPCHGGPVIFDLISLKCQDTLEELTLSSCELENECLMNAIVSLRKLKALNLDHTHIDDEVVSVIGSSCSALRTLSLNGCWWITDVSMNHLFVVEFSVDGVSGYGKCRSLESLQIDLTTISVSGVESVLRNAPKLRNLVHPDVVVALGRMHRYDLKANSVLPHQFALTSLHAGDCDGNGFLRKKSHARSLSIATQVCPNVENVILKVYRNIEETDALRPLSRMENLRNLDIECLGDVGIDVPFSEVVSVLCVSGRSITRLRLVAMASADVGIIGVCCPLLEDFHLSILREDVEESKKEIFIPPDSNRRPFTFLKHLYISMRSGNSYRWVECDLMPSQWKDLLSSRHLESITIRRSSSLNDSVLSQVIEAGQAFPNLRTLDLMLCPSITAVFVQSFLDLPNSLEAINIRSCLKLTKCDVESFKSFCAMNGFSVDLTFYE